jgi:uncharacterized membrane protein HdeD (DUF308 family)
MVDLFHYNGHTWMKESKSARWQPLISLIILIFIINHILRCNINPNRTIIITIIIIIFISTSCLQFAYATKINEIQQAICKITLSAIDFWRGFLISFAFQMKKGHIYIYYDDEASQVTDTYIISLIIWISYH